VAVSPQKLGERAQDERVVVDDQDREWRRSNGAQGNLRDAARRRT
jgi:hypothetical protein